MSYDRVIFDQGSHYRRSDLEAFRGSFLKPEKNDIENYIQRNKIYNEKREKMEEELQRLIEDFLTQKQTLLLQVKKGLLGKEDFSCGSGEAPGQKLLLPQG